MSVHIVVNGTVLQFCYFLPVPRSGAVRWRGRGRRPNRQGKRPREPPEASTWWPWWPAITSRGKNLSYAAPELRRTRATPHPKLSYAARYACSPAERIYSCKNLEPTVILSVSLANSWRIRHDGRGGRLLHPAVRRVPLLKEFTAYSNPFCRPREPPEASTWVLLSTRPL